MRPSASDLLSRNYGLSAKDLFAPLLEVFAAARSAFDGDVEKAVVLLEVAIRTLQDPRLAGLELNTVLRGELESYPSLSTNMRSIADPSGIPKVLKLVARNYETVAALQNRKVRAPDR